MTVEARDYVAEGLAADRETVAFGDRSLFDCEALCLTTRLSQVMAWLLVQRAVHAGEIGIGELQDDSHRLDGREVCFDNVVELVESLPLRFRSLMERSLKLYQRIARLTKWSPATFLESWPHARCRALKFIADRAAKE